MMKMYDIDREKVIAQLNEILEAELAGTVRYSHYALMVFGHSRIPIISWLRAQATETLEHAHQAGEMITHLGGHPSLGIGSLLETHKHNIDEILHETMEVENQALQGYYKLLKLVDGKSIPLEEYARTMIAQETAHLDEIDKMLRRPGQIEVSKESSELDME